jgi:hypothetical protein
MIKVIDSVGNVYMIPGDKISTVSDLHDELDRSQSVVIGCTRPDGQRVLLLAGRALSPCSEVIVVSLPLLAWETVSFADSLILLHHPQK